MKMKINKMLFAAFLLLSSSVFAQQNEFDKAIDYCNCKLTSAYLTRYTSAMPADKTEKKSFEEIKDKFGKCEVGSSIEYSALSDLLDNNNFKYSNTNFSKIIDGVKSSYSDNLDKDAAVNKIISGIFENKTIDGAIKKYINADEIKPQLSKDIAAYFEGKFKSKEEVTNPKTDEGGKNTKNEELSNQIRDEVNSRMEELKPNPWSINYLSLILLIVGLVITLIIFMVKSSRLEDKLDALQQSREGQRKEINDMKRTVDNIGNSGGGKTVSNLKNNWQSEIEDKISETNKAVSRLDVSLSMLRGDIEKGGNSGNNFSNQTRVVEQQPKTEILYASIPSRDGFFNENAVSNAINPTASFYKLTITDTLGQKAKFEFLGNDERAVKDATNAPERILRPACKINNALNQNAKRIKTISQGTVIKQNGKWIIDTLAEIEYE
jgi:hypothetical protein